MKGILIVMVIVIVCEIVNNRRRGDRNRYKKDDNNSNKQEKEKKRKNCKNGQECYMESLKVMDQDRKLYRQKLSAAQSNIKRIVQEIYTDLAETDINERDVQLEKIGDQIEINKVNETEIKREADKIMEESGLILEKNRRRLAEDRKQMESAEIMGRSNIDQLLKELESIKNQMNSQNNTNNLLEQELGRKMEQIDKRVKKVRDEQDIKIEESRLKLSSLVAESRDIVDMYRQMDSIRQSVVDLHTNMTEFSEKEKKYVSEQEGQVKILLSIEQEANTKQHIDIKFEQVLIQLRLLIKYFDDLKKEIQDLNRKLQQYENQVLNDKKTVKMDLLNITNQLQKLSTKDELDKLISSNSQMSQTIMKGHEQMKFILFNLINKVNELWEIQEVYVNKGQELSGAQQEKGNTMRVEVNKEIIVIRENVRNLMKQFESNHNKYLGMMQKLNKIENENKNNMGKQDQYTASTKLFMDEQITTTKQLNEYLNGFRNRITDAFTKLDQIRARQQEIESKHNQVLSNTNKNAKTTAELVNENDRIQYEIKKQINVQILNLKQQISQMEVTIKNSKGLQYTKNQRIVKLHENIEALKQLVVQVEEELDMVQLEGQTKPIEHMNKKDINMLFKTIIDLMHDIKTNSSVIVSQQKDFIKNSSQNQFILDDQKNKIKDIRGQGNSLQGQSLDPLVADKSISLDSSYKEDSRRLKRSRQRHNKDSSKQRSNKVMYDELQQKYKRRKKKKARSADRLQ